MNPVTIIGLVGVAATVIEFLAFNQIKNSRDSDSLETNIWRVTAIAMTVLSTCGLAIGVAFPIGKTISNILSFPVALAWIAKLLLTVGGMLFLGSKQMPILENGLNGHNRNFRTSAYGNRYR